MDNPSYESSEDPFESESEHMQSDDDDVFEDLQREYNADRKHQSLENS